MSHDVESLRKVFGKGKVLINYLTAGYPTLTASYDNLFKLTALGTDVIEIGVPFSDPTADGPTIQRANQIALENGVTLEWILELVERARDNGLQVPILLMGYYNVFFNYGLENLIVKSREIGINGFIIVDLPPDLNLDYYHWCQREQRALITLIARNTPEMRIKTLVNYASGFIYCLATNGVTGSRDKLDPELHAFVDQVRRLTHLPIAVGFGISSPEQAQEVWSFADGLIMGSSIINNLDQITSFLEPFNAVKVKLSVNPKTKISGPEKSGTIRRDMSGGGTGDRMGHMMEDRTGESDELLGLDNSYLPEILVSLHQEVARNFQDFWDKPCFQQEYGDLLANYVGRPTPLYLAKNLSAENGGAQIWLKREDLNHTGSHKINNALGQALLAKKMGKTKVIAETGAGQHGIATATACSLLGLKCDIYMGAADVQRQAKNVEKIRLLGANLISVERGSKTLRDAINAALQDWVSSLETTYYLIGSAIGAAPYPEMVRKFQSVIGSETREQFRRQFPNEPNKLPDYLIACVGGGSNAIGFFSEFIQDSQVKLVGVEAGGNGIQNSASIGSGTLGILHGTKTYLIQDENGQIKKTHSISAGLDYPGIGPDHTKLYQSRRATYVSINDQEAVSAFRQLTRLEGIIPALESSHAIAYALKLGKTLESNQQIIVNLSGRGEKDIDLVNRL